MKALTKILQEIHKTELVSVGLKKLYNKYKKHPQKEKLYVNFSNTADDPIIKAPVWRPDHQDPVGIYAYPLQFILDMIEHIPYASGRKYIRIIKDKSKNKLILNDLKSAIDLHKLLIKMKVTPADYGKVKELENAFPSRIRDPNKIAKLFFQFAQTDLSNWPLTRIKNPIEQTRFFVEKGFDAIEDKSESGDEAIIADNEPTQIVFLKRDAFEVIEVIEQEEKGKSNRLMALFQKIVTKAVELSNLKPTKRNKFSVSWFDGWVFLSLVGPEGSSENLLGLEIVGNGLKQCLADFWKGYYSAVKKGGYKRFGKMMVRMSPDKTVLEDDKEWYNVFIFVEGLKSMKEWYSKEKLFSMELDDLGKELSDFLIYWANGKVKFTIKDFYGGEQEFTTTMPKFVEHNFDNEFTKEINDYLWYLANEYNDYIKKQKIA